MKEQLIESWIKCLLTENKVPSHLVDKSFDVEDGMSLSEYWDYECHNFTSLASIHDLTTDLSVKIIAEYKLQEKDYCFIYIYNSKNKIVCKMSITLIDKENNYLITSNNFKSQIVPKFALQYEEIREVGMAIKCEYPIVKIISPQLETRSFGPSPDFLDEKFYSVRFVETNIENQLVDFFIYIENEGKVIKEKRKIFFDTMQKNLKPYVIKDSILKLVDENYPVNIVAYSKNGEFKKAYPRNISLKLTDYDYFIITDCLDNDWEINSHHLLK